MKIFKLLGFFFIGILLTGENIEVEARSRISKAFRRLGRRIRTAGRKLLDKPPKHRSRFDKYPLYIMRYHMFIWKRYFRHHLNNVDDGRPSLPHPKCWSIRCWMRRNKFKRYWKWRAPIPIEGKNSPPFLHRRCRMPGTHGVRCAREHIRHDYYWRMFMWIGRHGFPKPPQRKRICITSYCRWQKKLWSRYWKNFWFYTSLVPVIRPFDFNWRFWFMRFAGNPMRLQQIVGPAITTMGFGRMLMTSGMGMMMSSGMGMGGMGMFGNTHMTLEMKQAMLGLMQRNLAQTMHIASVSQQALHRQQMGLMMLMRMPAYPSAISAQMQMQAMMRNMYYQQYMQQYRMQMMLQQQIWGMARYLRGYCGCSMCSAHGHSYHMPVGSSMYVGHSGYLNPIHPPGMMGRSPISGAAFIKSPTMMMPLNPVNNPIELKMRVQALYAKNNLPVHA